MNDSANLNVSARAVEDLDVIVERARANLESAALEYAAALAKRNATVLR